MAETPRGAITLWGTILFREYKMLSFNERVSHLAFNETGSLLSCCGVRRTCIWKVKSGALVSEVKSPRQERAIKFKLDKDETLMIVTDLKRVYSLAAQESTDAKSQWLRLGPSSLSPRSTER